MSPEQVQGEELDPRTDLFSFGVVIYEMATGRLPFERKTAGATFAAILHEPPEPVTRWNSQLPVKLDEILSKALQKDRQLRYQHASEIRSDLQQLKAVTKSAPTPPGHTKSIATPPREVALSRRNVWKIAVPLGVILLALLGAIIFWLAHKPAPRATNLNEKDTIVLADFANTTGDAVFDISSNVSIPAPSLDPGVRVHTVLSHSRPSNPAPRVLKTATNKMHRVPLASSALPSAQSAGRTGRNGVSRSRSSADLFES